MVLRERSVITGGGGVQKRPRKINSCVQVSLPEKGYKRGGGGASEVLPLQKRGMRKSFCHAEMGGGGTECFEVVLTREVKVLAILPTGGGGYLPKVSLGTHCEPEPKRGGSESRDRRAVTTPNP